MKVATDNVTSQCYYVKK